MKTFKSFSAVANTTNGTCTWNYVGELSNRSLAVLVKSASNPNRATIYNLATKCRSTDIETIVRAMTRMLLAELREMYVTNNTTAAMSSKRTVSSQLRKMLAGTELLVANRYGNIIEGAGIKCKEGTLRDVFKFNSKMPLYIRFVENGEPWESDNVQMHLKHYITATIEQMDYITRLDNALDTAANANDAEEVELHEEFAEPAMDVAETLAEAV